MPEITINLKQIILLSQTMLEKARDESWDEIFVLEKTRGELLDSFLSSVVKPEYSQEVAAGIKTVIEIDKDIMALGQLKKLDLAQMLQTMGQGIKAVKAYTS